jgi:hypothetical protein
LGDNRYRIYLIREDGNELLLKDFYLRNHRPFEIEEAPTSPEYLKVDERLLDENSAGVNEMPHGMPTAGIQEFHEREFDLQERRETSGEVKEEEGPLNHAMLATGTIAQTMRSWRKAARRFRAG